MKIPSLDPSKAEIWSRVDRHYPASDSNLESHSELDNVDFTVQRAEDPSHLKSFLLHLIELRNRANHLFSSRNFAMRFLQALSTSILNSPVNILAPTLDWHRGFAYSKLNVDHLSSIAHRLGLSEQSNVYYVGCRNDLSVAKVFPNTVHLDLTIPSVIEKYFQHVKADARQIPAQDHSVDAIVLKAFPPSVFKSPSCLKEFSRILTYRGVLIIYLNGVAESDYPVFEQQGLYPISVSFDGPGMRHTVFQKR